MILSRFIFRALTLFGVVGSINAQADAQQHTQTESRAVSTIPTLSVDRDHAVWIWTGEVAGTPASIGPRAFRKKLPEGKSRATCVTFAISCVEAYTVAVNGVSLGSQPMHPNSPTGLILDVYSVSLSHETNVISVVAANNDNVALLFVTGVVQYTDGSEIAFGTDTSWLTAGPNVPPPPTFAEIGFDDSKWPHAVVVTVPTVTPLVVPPFTGKVCGLSDNAGAEHGNGDKGKGRDGPFTIPSLPTVCPALPPLTEGSKSLYWDLRHQVDCEIRRLEEALYLCQREKQSVIDQLIIIIKQITTFGGGSNGGRGGLGSDFCQLINCGASTVTQVTQHLETTDDSGFAIPIFKE